MITLLSKTAKKSRASRRRLFPLLSKVSKYHLVILSETKDLLQA
jgi:hypothetical protein